MWHLPPRVNRHELETTNRYFRDGQIASFDGMRHETPMWRRAEHRTREHVARIVSIMSDDNSVPILPQMPLTYFQMCVAFLIIFPMWKWASSGDRYERAAHISLASNAYYLCACLSLVIAICCLATTSDILRRRHHIGPGDEWTSIHIANCAVGAWSLFTCFVFMTVSNKCTYSFMLDLSRAK